MDAKIAELKREYEAKVLEMKKLQDEKFRKLRRRLRPAWDRGKHECVRCGWCCSKRTCALIPDEVELLAKYLGEPLEKTVRTHLVIDRLSYNDRDYYFLRVAAQNISSFAGKPVPYAMTFDEGPCIFLDHRDSLSSCRIHEVGLHQTKAGACWVNTSQEEVREYDRYFFEKWEGNILQMRFGLKIP